MKSCGFEISPSNYDPYLCVHLHEDQNVSPSASKMATLILSIENPGRYSTVGLRTPVREDV